MLRLDVPALLGARGEALAATRLGLKTMLTSLGHQSAGALTLFNYPMWMRDVIPQNPDGTDRDTPIDLASLESKECHIIANYMPFYADCCGLLFGAT